MFSVWSKLEMLDQNAVIIRIGPMGHMPLLSVVYNCCYNCFLFRGAHRQKSGGHGAFSKGHQNGWSISPPRSPAAGSILWKFSVPKMFIPMNKKICKKYHNDIRRWDLWAFAHLAYFHNLSNMRHSWDGKLPQDVPSRRTNGHCFGATNFFECTSKYRNQTDTINISFMSN